MRASAIGMGLQRGRWTGVVVVAALAVAGPAGFAATRASGPFNPPFWAHTYTAVVGVALLI